MIQGGGGVKLFRGVVQMLISIETHITCDFPGGRVWIPYPPSGSAHASSTSVGPLPGNWVAACIADLTPDLL